MDTRTSPFNAWENRGRAIATIAMAAPRGAIGWSGSLAHLQHRRSERGSAAALAVLLHGAAIALVLVTRAPAATAEAPGLATFDVAHSDSPDAHRHAQPRIAAPMSAAAAPAPVLQVASIDVAQTLIQIAPMISADDSAAVTPASLGADCDLTQPVQDALRNSDDVRRRLPEIPADRRSVANAIMVWNAGWANDGAAPMQGALAAIRQTISQAVTASSPQCRNQLQRGPRLVFLPGATGAMTVLALGSGQWTWQQLVDGGQPVPAAALAAADPPPPAFASGRPAERMPGPTSAIDAMLASLIPDRSPTALPYNP